MLAGHAPLRGLRLAFQQQLGERLSAIELLVSMIMVVLGAVQVALILDGLAANRRGQTGRTDMPRTQGEMPAAAKHPMQSEAGQGQEMQAERRHWLLSARNRPTGCRKKSAYIIRLRYNRVNSVGSLTRVETSGILEMLSMRVHALRGC